MKQKRYWLRGTVISGLILGAYQLIVWLIGEKCLPIGDACYNTFNVWLIPISNFLSTIDVFYYLVAPFSDTTPGWEFLIHVFTIWPSFIFLGLLFGWFYGKFKNRNKINL